MGSFSFPIQLSGQDYQDTQKFSSIFAYSTKENILKLTEKDFILFSHYLRYASANNLSFEFIWLILTGDFALDFGICLAE